MKHDLPEREFTEVNEGNEELAWSSLPWLPSVARQGFHPLVPAGGAERHTPLSLPGCVQSGDLPRVPFLDRILTVAIAP